MIKTNTPILLYAFILFTTQALGQSDFEFASEEEYQYLHDMGKRTAKQSWWFFEERLTNNEPEYKYFRVFLEFQNVWLKDIKKISDDTFVGTIDPELPYDAAMDLSQPFKFDKAEVDDWMLVDDYYMLGGFTVRIKPFEERKKYMKAGQFRTNCSATNDDFRILSAKKAKVSLETSIFLDSFYKGGTRAFFDSLSSNLYFNDYSLKLGIHGCVILECGVTPEGTISYIKTIQSPGGGLSDIAKNALNAVASGFIPEKERKEVIILQIPICFKLELGRYK